MVLDDQRQPVRHGRYLAAGLTGRDDHIVGNVGFAFKINDDDIHRLMIFQRFHDVSEHPVRLSGVFGAVF